jgi:hypothetical protein
MNRYSYLGRFLESILFILIVLVIFETYTEELAVYMNMGVDIRKLLLIAGFCFDVIFSIEFFVRLVMAGRRKKLGTYLAREGGIIDFFASLPLLVLHSGPLFFMTYMSGEMGIVIFMGSLNILKIVKTIRIIRVFRFIRAMKLFGRVRPRYEMTPRYIGSVLIIVITITVAALIGFDYLENSEVIQPRAMEVKKILEPSLAAGNPEELQLLFGESRSILFIEGEGETILRNIDPVQFKATYFNDDYYVEEISGYSVYFDNKDVKRVHAIIHMLIFNIIIATIIAITTIYRRFFNRHIASATNVMVKGFKTADYSTPVRIQERRMDFEIYQLANQYNRKWLPIKRRIIELKREKG